MKAPTPEFIKAEIRAAVIRAMDAGAELVREEYGDIALTESCSVTLKSCPHPVVCLMSALALGQHTRLGTNKCSDEVVADALREKYGLSSWQINHIIDGFDGGFRNDAWNRVGDDLGIEFLGPISDDDEEDF